MRRPAVDHGPPAPSGGLLEDWLWALAAVLFYLPVANGCVLYLLVRFGDYGVRARTLGFAIGRDATLGAIVGLVLAGAWLLFTRRTAVGTRLARALAGAPERPSMRLWTACVAAVGEELLFRAVLQPLAGPVAATALFAAVHVPWRRDLWPWPLTALVTGAALAALYAGTGAILAGVVAQVVLGLTAALPPASASTGSAR